MTNPVVIICGNAGAGKDTTASYIAEHYDGVCIGQADPMKHMVREWFGFTNEQLFGPSECRNAVDPRFDFESDDPPVEGFVTETSIGQKISNCGPDWCVKLFGKDTAVKAMAKLRDWFWNTVVPRSRLDKGLSARFVLQTLGTEWGRAIEPMVWTRHAATTALKLLGGGIKYDRINGPLDDPDFQGYGIALITDGRFRNEILHVKAATSGIAVELRQPDGPGPNAALTAGVAGHRSEMELNGVPRHFYDYVILNDGDIPRLYSKADFVANSILKGGRTV